VDDTRPAVATRRLPDAVGQALGLAAVHRQVGSTNAAPLGTDRSRMTPGDHLRRNERWLHA